MKIGNIELRLFKRDGLVLEVILIKDPAPSSGWVFWLGLGGIELTIRT